MARDPKYDVLFEPVQIGPKTLRNRFYQVPHCIGAGSEKPGMQAFHRGIKAEGGWAAVCTEYCSISPESDDTMRVSARIWDDGDVQNLAAMCDRLHQYGALAGIELWYGGPHAPCHESRDTPRGPSQIASEFESNIYPRYMDSDDIRRVQRYYVDGAKRAREAGFDIIYVYGAHSYLPLQFLSPWSNKRTDEYGGAFENRARFWRESLEQVREAVGDDCAIASRFAVDTLYGPAGVELEKDGYRFVEYVDHLVDLWDLTVGDIAEWGQNAGPSRFFEENHEKPYTGTVKPGNHTNKPVVGVGRIVSPDTMLQIINSGQFDIIGAARPSISDPFLPRKIEEGRKARNSEKGVLVVGAGPAGMECAMILGKREMSAVHLVEAQDEIGGNVNWVSSLGHSDGKQNIFRGTARGLGDWKRIVNYRQIQLDKLRNVEIHTSSRLDAAQIREYGAEIVVIATGCHWATDGLNSVTHDTIPGADASLPWQLTPEDVALERKPLGQRVLILENEAYFMGVTLAQKLAGEGHEIWLLTQRGEIGKYMEFTLEAPMMHRELHRLGVHIRPETHVNRFEQGLVSAYNVWDPSHTEEIEVDSVVLCTARVSDDQLYHELKADPAALQSNDVEAVYLIGDAAAPRMIVDCIFDGHRLAREIDSSDPSVPLPFIRERRLWGSVDNMSYEGQLMNSSDMDPMPAEVFESGRSG